MANRYTQLSASEYRPMSFQELAIAPSMLRQQHDQATAQQEALRTELNAYSNPLSQHQEEAMALQQSMNGVIDKQAEELAMNGYNKNSGGALSRLNREFRNLTSPTGRLGQINAARDAYVKNREEFMKSADSMKWGRAVSERAWNKHASQYGGYDENGAINQIGTLGSPEQYRVMDFAKDAKPLLGNIKRRLDKVSGGSIRERSDGNGWEIVNQSGQIMQDTNVDQLNQMYQAGAVEFFTPGMRGYESAMFEGISPQQLKLQYDNVMNSMLKDEITDTRNMSISLHGTKNQKDLVDESGGGTLITELMGNNLPVPSKFNTPQKLDSYINGIQSKGSPSKEEYDDYKRALFIKSQLESTLSNDPNYQAGVKQLGVINKKHGLPVDFSPSQLEVKQKEGATMGFWENVMNPSQPDYYYKGNKISSKEYNGYLVKQRQAEKESKVLDKELNNVKNNYMLKTSTNLMQKLDPQSTKTENDQKQVENNMLSSMQSPNFFTNNNVTIKSFKSNSDSSITYLDPSKNIETSQDVSELLGKVKQGDMQVRKFKWNAGAGSMTIDVDVKLDDKADNSRVGGYFKGGKIKSGGTATITMEIPGDMGMAIGNTFSNLTGQTSKPGIYTPTKTGYGTNNKADIGSQNAVMNFENRNANYTWNQVSQEEVIQNPELIRKLKTTYETMNNGKSTNDSGKLLKLYNELAEQGYKINTY